MIVTSFEKLGKLPVGATATLVMRIKVVRAHAVEDAPCDGCIFLGSACSHCCSMDRDDKESVKFVDANKH